MPATPTTTLDAAIVEVERALAAAEAQTASATPGTADWFVRHRAAMEACAATLTAATGARVRDHWDGAAVRIAGVASTSTSGLRGALQNWLAAARRRRDAT